MTYKSTYQTVEQTNYRSDQINFQSGESKGGEVENEKDIGQQVDLMWSSDATQKNQGSQSI